MITYVLSFGQHGTAICWGLYIQLNLGHWSISRVKRQCLVLLAMVSMRFLLGNKYYFFYHMHMFVVSKSWKENKVIVRHNKANSSDNSHVYYIFLKCVPDRHFSSRLSSYLFFALW